MCGDKEQNLLEILLEEAFMSSLLGSQRKQKRDNGRQWKKEDNERERENSEFRRKWFNEKEKQPLKLMKRTEVSWEQPRNREGEKHRVHLL